MRPALMMPSVVRLRFSSRIKTRKRSPSSHAVERRVYWQLLHAAHLEEVGSHLCERRFLFEPLLRKKRKERKGCMPSACSARLKDAHKRYTGNFTLFLLAVMDHIVLKYSVHGWCQTVLLFFFPRATDRKLQRTVVTVLLCRHGVIVISRTQPRFCESS